MNLFVQDEIKLSDKWELTAGIKLERNDYTGWGVPAQPAARVETSGSATGVGRGFRAVRAPSRFDRDVFFPPSGPPFLIARRAEFRVRGR